MGNGGCRQFITLHLCHSLLLTSPAAPWGLTHRRQSFTNFFNIGSSHGLQLFPNCSSMGHSHRVQSFRNRLLQRGSHTRSQVLPEDPLQCELVSISCSYCQQTAPVQALHRLQFSPRHIHLLWHGVLYRLQGGYLLHRSPPRRGQP